MSLDHLWQLSYDSKAIDVLRNAKYAIPLIQSVHLFGITVLLGCTVMFNLRLLGIGLRELPLAELSRQLWRWAVVALLVTMVSGFFVFLPDPARYAANTAFRLKMVLLCLAVVFQFTVFRKVIRSEPPPRGPRSVIVACLSLMLWFLVGWSGRAIAFLG